MRSVLSIVPVAFAMVLFATLISVLPSLVDVFEILTLAVS